MLWPIKVSCTVSGAGWACGSPVGVGFSIRAGQSDFGRFHCHLRMARRRRRAGWVPSGQMAGGLKKRVPSVWSLAGSRGMRGSPSAGVSRGEQVNGRMGSCQSLPAGMVGWNWRRAYALAHMACLPGRHGVDWVTA
ncbi:hypothetical protein RI056_08765 [Komagataeibacter nataicola]|uniref:hypothetical protein n=1 Tax=Komagataeibacter nataicola TaxID=265960 RepID=UPI0028ABF2E7|nr:hypothetical protein [Komagataeibacter nataicola]WNM09918.1 hypothetical protein RI056_08765 [Komagataeibacter nataicola]